MKVEIDVESFGFLHFFLGLSLGFILGFAIHYAFKVVGVDDPMRKL